VLKCGHIAHFIWFLQLTLNQPVSYLAPCLQLLIALPLQRRPNAMTQNSSVVNQNQIHKSLVPMLRTWAHSIGWTVLLSAALAILFAMICGGGCSGIH
jgi:hypothetical protein